MEKSSYRPRLVDAKVEQYLATFGAVCIEGPKWCGKTWTSSMHCVTAFYVGDPAMNFRNRNMAAANPELALAGDRPHLIDEWQEVPPIWDAVRFAVDKTGEKGQFLLTGSATPRKRGILHSGIGRIAKIGMKPMSLFESGDSDGQVSLEDLFQGLITPKVGKLPSLDTIIQWIIRGGWPGSLGLDFKLAKEIPRSYINGLLLEDLVNLDGVRRDIHKMHLLMKSLARNESTTAGIKTLQSDIQVNDDESVSVDSVNEYLNVLSRLFLIANQPPFASSLRSSVRVKAAEKRHFVDPSLTAALLGATVEQLSSDLCTLGFLFEGLCERDLGIYAETLNGKLYHYQDYNNREVDAIVELENGVWGAFEIKLGANQIDSAAAGLLAFQRMLRRNNAPEPKFLCVLCGFYDAAYCRPDGVWVIPINMLKP